MPLRAPTRFLIAAFATALAGLAMTGPAQGEGTGVTVGGKGAGADGCASVNVFRLPVSGGCRFEAVTEAMHFDLVTPFGVARLATCRVTYTGNVDSRGDVWLTVGRTRGDSPCVDLRACRVKGVGVRAPWMGTIYAGDDGGFHVDVDVCLDTCIGWFEGSARFELVRTGGEWRLRADAAAVGETGLELDGELRLDRPDLRVKAGVASF